MFLIAITAAVAAQFSMPHPIGVPDVRAVFSGPMYPRSLAEAGVSGTVYTRTTVRPDGSIQGCVAEVSSGSTELDTFACRIILERAKFLPAKWIDGTPTYGVIRFPAVWRLSADSSSMAIPDLEVSVNQLPKGAHSLVTMRLAVAADENGHPVDCEDEFSSLDDPRQHFPELVPGVCQAVMASYRVQAPTDASGKAVRSVQSILVQVKRGR